MDIEQGHGPEDQDTAERAFEALRDEVAALRRGIELVYRQAQQAPAAPEMPDYNHTLGVLAKTLQEVGGRVDAVSAAVNDSVGGLARDFAETRRVVRDAATEAGGAAEQGRDAARAAAEHAGSVREALLGDRTTMVLILVTLLVMGGLGLGSGWGLRGWWAPPPAGVFARYLAAGNDPNWLLCDGGGKRYTTDPNASACELKFWLEKPGP